VFAVLQIPTEKERDLSESSERCSWSYQENHAGSSETDFTVWNV